ncbi:hypothetical protein BGZ65_007556 [Modicella reniformis]|uniref:Uncharacterized protein n=1 Tax=Modicella reniformis TaxID=1440133 RepID=A0A9P6MLE3_9FUNG|nr:hypothetical protein BGZ65_007556 [Modicella reniformis]
MHCYGDESNDTEAWCQTCSQIITEAGDYQPSIVYLFSKQRSISLDDIAEDSSLRARLIKSEMRQKAVMLTKELDALASERGQGLMDDDRSVYMEWLRRREFTVFWERFLEPHKLSCLHTDHLLRSLAHFTDYCPTFFKETGPQQDASALIAAITKERHLALQTDKEALGKEMNGGRFIGAMNAYKTWIESFPSQPQAVIDKVSRLLF